MLSIHFDNILKKSACIWRPLLFRMCDILVLLCVRISSLSLFFVHYFVKMFQFLLKTGAYNDFPKFNLIHFLFLAFWRIHIVCTLMEYRSDDDDGRDCVVWRQKSKFEHLILYKISIKIIFRRRVQCGRMGEKRDCTWIFFCCSL